MKTQCCENHSYNEADARKSHTICRICEKQIKKFDSIECGISTAAVYYEHPTQHKPYFIDVYYCQECAFMQTLYTAPENFYEDYCFTGFVTYNYFASERKRQIEIMTSASQNRGLFIDIGCGSGSCLEIAQTVFDEVLGIEPSKAFAKVLEEKKLPYIADYFTKELIGEKKCDFFFSSQVFEHLEEPFKILKDIFDACNNNAVGMIEVPNGQYNWVDKEFTYITPDHINYYSTLSLSLLAHKAGFFVEYCNCYDGKNIEILLRKRIPKKSFSAEKENLISELKKLPKNKIISFWGAGARMFALLPIIEKYTTVYRIYDSDPGKHGRYIPGCKTEISKPYAEDINKNDVIILLNTKYDNEILDDLSNKYLYTGKTRFI